MQNTQTYLTNPEHLIKMFALQEQLNQAYNGPDWRSVVSFGKAQCAFFDEVSEFLREIESTWKWWKPEAQYNKQKALYELIDVLHFGLLLIQRKYPTPGLIEETISLTPTEPYLVDIIGYDAEKLEAFSYIVAKFISQIGYHDDDLNTEIRYLRTIVEIGARMIGIDNPQDVFNAYVMKNQRNHERVAGGILTGQYDKTKESDIPNGI